MSEMRDWRAAANYDGEVEWSWVGLQLAMLISIRNEMRTLNSVMQCRNVQKGFRALTRIARQDEIAFKRRVNAAVQKRIKRAKP